VYNPLRNTGSFMKKERCLELDPVGRASEIIIVIGFADGLDYAAMPCEHYALPPCWTAPMAMKA
jgi:hypothetical protein